VSLFATCANGCHSVHFNIVLPQHWDVSYGLDTCGALVRFPAGTRDWLTSSPKCPDRLCSVKSWKVKSEWSCTSISLCSLACKGATFLFYISRTSLFLCRVTYPNHFEVFSWLLITFCFHFAFIHFSVRVISLVLCFKHSHSVILSSLADETKDN